MAMLLLGISFSSPVKAAGPYTSNLPITKDGGTNAYEDKVIIDNVEYPCIKLGTSSKTGSFILTVPAETTTLSFYAVAWKGQTTTLEITGATCSPASLSLAGNDKATGNSPYDKFSVSASDYYTVTLSGIEKATELTFATTGKRCIIFGFNTNATGDDGGEVVPEPVVDITNTPSTAYTASEAIALIEAGKGLDDEVYVKGTVCEVTEVSTQYGNATFTITDGAEKFLVYRAYSFNGAKFEDEKAVEVGDEVVVFGKLTNYKGTYELATGGQLFFLTKPEGVTVDSPWQGDYVLPGGIYYLYNPAAKGFVAGGSSWGTRAVFAEDAYPVTIEEVEGGYALKTVTNAWIGKDIYVDQNPAAVLQLEQVGKYIYTIKFGDNYLGYTTNNEVNSTKELGAGCYWQFITKPRLIAQLKDATPEAPMSATALIGMSNFSRADQSFDKYWTKDRMNGNGGALGGDDTNNCYEIWNSDAAGFDFNQTITNLPAGTYCISAQGFYRQGTPAEDCAAYQNGTLIDIPVKLYANGASKTVLSARAELSAINEGTGTAIGKYPDSMTQASHYFSAGCYWNYVFVEIEENEDLKFGFVKDGGVAGDWFICDNFQLTYYGNVKKAAELQAAADLAAAKALLTKDIAALESTVTKAKAALALASDGDIDALKAAIEAGSAAVTAAKKTLAGATKAAEAEEASAKAVEAAKAIEAAKANVEFTPTVESPWLGDAFDANAIAKLYNPNAGQFFGSAATTSPWATQASTDPNAVNFTLVAAEEEDFYKFVCTLYADRTIGWDASADPQFFNDITTQAVTTYKFEKIATANARQNVYSIYVKAVKSDGSAAIEGYLYADGPASKISVKESLDETCFWQFFDESGRIALKDAIEAASATAYETIALQTTDAAAAGYIWTNAQEASEGPIANLLDGDSNTFFHSDWHGNVTDPHYLEVDMGEGQSISEFAIKYQRRMNNNNNRPTEIIIEGSNDGETFTAIRTLTAEADGLPTVQGNDTYTSPIISAGAAYRYVRFTVSQTNNGSIFFTFSEFGLVSKSASYDAVIAAVEEAKVVLNDPMASKADCLRAKGRLEGTLAGKRTIETKWDGEAVDVNAIAQLYNLNAGQFFGSAATTAPWATQASTTAAPVQFTLAEEEGLYKFICTAYADRTMGWDGGGDGWFFVDITTQASTLYEFERVETADPGQYIYGIYVKSTKNDGSASIEGYLYADGPDSPVLLKETLDETGYWQFFDQTDKLALKDAILAASDKAYEALSLQTSDASAPGYLWSNAPDQAEGQHPEYMLDGNPNTFFHSDWHGVVTDPHYLEIDMGEGESISEFAIKYQRRMNNNNNRPTEIIIEGSNDGETFTAIRTLTAEADGLPTVQGNDVFTSAIIDAGAYYRYLRFTVSQTNNGSIFFTFSEFGLVTKSLDHDVITEAVAAAQAVYDDPNAKKADYVDAKERLEATLAKATSISGEEGTTGIQNTVVEVAERVIYTANGAIVSEPVEGINIVKTVMTDGSVKVEKIFVK